MGSPEVVVTGVGMVTSLGATASASAEAWQSGGRARRRCLAKLAGTRLEGAEAAVPPELDAGARLGSRRMLKYMSPAAVLGCVAAHEAAASARLRGRHRPERVGLFAGAGLASMNVEDVVPVIRQSLDGTGRLSYRLLGERGLAVANPLLSFKVLANMPPCVVSILEQVKGPNYIFTPWEGQTGAALLEGWAAVAEGEVDCALVGGADAPDEAATVACLRQGGLLADGEYPASGAAYMVLERADSARRDAQRIHARLDGVELSPSSGPVCDPLAERMGRTFAAAPAILTALACLGSGGRIMIRGADRQEFRADVEAFP
jgi:3-oxoacyl-(acyl-carrier-protein) synthase